MRRVLAFFCAFLAVAACAVGATAAGPDPAPRVQGASASCTTDAGGHCTATHTLGGVVHSVVVTPVIAAGAQHYTLSVVSGSVTASQFRVRAVKPGGSAYGSVPITFFYMAAGVADIPPTTTTPLVTTTTTAPPVTTTTTQPPAQEWPNRTNRGNKKPKDQLVRKGGDDFQPAAGEVWDGISANALVINQPNVTIRNSVIDDSIIIESGGSLVIEDSTIGPECKPEARVNTWLSGAIEGANYTARRLHIQGHEDGFKVGGANIRVEDSFVDICGYPGAHSDGMQDYPQADGLVIDHNTVDLRGEPGQNAAINVNAGDQGPVCVSNNVRISNNLVMGGGYTLTLCPTNTGWEVTGNRIVAGSSPYGPWSVAHGCKGVWDKNNVVTIDENYVITGTVESDRPC